MVGSARRLGDGGTIPLVPLVAVPRPFSSVPPAVGSVMSSVCLRFLPAMDEDVEEDEDNDTDRALGVDMSPFELPLIGDAAGGVAEVGGDAGPSPGTTDIGDVGSASALMWGGVVNGGNGPARG